MLPNETRKDQEYRGKPQCDQEMYKKRSVRLGQVPGHK